MKYLTKEQLETLTDQELDRYAAILTEYQLKVIEVMDIWIDGYNLASDEYDRRKVPTNKILIANDSDTKH